MSRPEYVLVRVSLHHTGTKQQVIYNDPTAYPSIDAAGAHWTEGECSCDCNRGLAIWKATNQGVAMPDAVQLPCRRGQRTVIKVTELEFIVVREAEPTTLSLPL